MLGAFDAVEGGVGLQGNATDLRIQFFQAARRTHEGAAGAHHGNEMGDTALGLLPDFFRCAMVVGLPVGWVRVLVGVEIFFRFAGVEFARGADRAIGAVRGIGVNDVGAVSKQNALALD